MCFFIEFEPLCQKLWTFCQILALLTMSANQIWSCHVTQDANFENFVFFPNSTFNIRKVTKFPVKKLSSSEVISKNLTGGGKHPPPPSAFRVNTLIKALSKGIDFEALTLFISNRKFNGFLDLKFQIHLASQSYRLDKLICKNINTSFPYLELE